MKAPTALTVALLTFIMGWVSEPAMAQDLRPANNRVDPGVAIASLRSDQLKALSLKYLEGGDEEGFWRATQEISNSGGYPFVQERGESSGAPDDYVLLTFLHRAIEIQPDNVLLFANINHVLASELLFERIAESGVYFKSVEVPPAVRFQYRIIENDPLTSLYARDKYGTRMHLLGGDPDFLNPNKKVYPDGLGEGEDYIATWVELPGASRQPYIVDQGNANGELIAGEHESEMLGYSRQIFTFLPPNYEPDREYPLLILLDGESYFSLGYLQTTLENLIADGSIPPLIVLGLNAGKKDGQTQRNDEFTCNPQFMDFVNDELLPWFTSNYKVSADPDQRVIAGSSFGGLFAAYFAFNHPETVSNVLSQSGSYHWGRDEEEVGYEWLVREFAFKEKQPIHIFMEVGTLEGEYSWMYPEFPHQLLSHRHFKTVLDMRGYDVTYHEYGGGHEMLSWRGGIAEGLKQLFRPVGLN
jgi:enterochelin esterase-like enzyme